MKNVYADKLSLIEDIKKLIKKENRYLTRIEIYTTLNIDKHLLEYFKIKTAELNKDLGFKKPHSCFETIYGKYLLELYPDAQSQKTFDDCKSDQGYLLKYDYYIPSLKILIECDGEQHEKWCKFFHTLESFEYAHNLDRIKTEYAKRNNYNLIRIPYLPIITKEIVEDSVKTLGTSCNNLKVKRQSAAEQINFKDFKPVKGYEDLYMISKNGELYNIKFDALMKFEISNSGYYRADLRRNGTHNKVSIHRLVAQHWIPNPENKPNVNHLDCDKLNNNIDNLEWCTYTENMRYAVEMGNKWKYKFILTDEKGESLEFYGSEDLDKFLGYKIEYGFKRFVGKGFIKAGKGKGFKIEKINLRVQRLSREGVDSSESK